jgi:hypothetical protein
MPAGVFIGKVLGEKAETGDPADDALRPLFIFGSYRVFALTFVLDASSLVAIGCKASGKADGLVVENPSCRT